MIYDLSDDDIKAIANLCFEPQKLHNILERKKLIPVEKAPMTCPHTVARWTKLGEISDPSFESLQYAYKCTTCGVIIEKPQELHGLVPKVFK